MQTLILRFWLPVVSLSRGGEGNGIYHKVHNLHIREFTRLCRSLPYLELTLSVRLVIGCLLTKALSSFLLADIEFPANWVPQPTNPKGVEETVHLFQLDPTRDVGEYNEVSDKFRQSCSENIIKIERVQNPTLYKQYAVRKQEMDKERARGSNEMSLFHGTKGPKCDHINHKGFNRSFCGENGKLMLADGFLFLSVTWKEVMKDCIVQ